MRFNTIFYHLAVAYFFGPPCRSIGGNNVNYEYSVQVVEKGKDLGIMFSSDMKSE